MKVLLMTKEIEAKTPRLYANEERSAEETMITAKFFTPDSNWTWYVTEYDPEQRLCFGLVDGFEAELGYFSLDEIESVTGPLGLSVERDRHFTPCTLADMQRRIKEYR